MLKVETMTDAETGALLGRIGYGHLGCTRDGHPYVVPMHYVYDGKVLYFLTTEGTKTDYLAANSEVCLQVEALVDPANWESVMVMGHARRLTDVDEIERAIQLIEGQNPTLTPALSHAKFGAWRRANRSVIFRIDTRARYGRKATSAPELAELPCPIEVLRTLQKTEVPKP